MYMWMNEWQRRQLCWFQDKLINTQYTERNFQLKCSIPKLWCTSMKSWPALAHRHQLNDMLLYHAYWSSDPMTLRIECWANNEQKIPFEFRMVWKICLCCCYMKHDDQTKQKQKKTRKTKMWFCMRFWLMWAWIIE